jgi:hypothetical protein
MVFIFLEFLSHTRNVLESVEYWYEIGQGFACPVISVDNKAQIFEVILKCDG